MTRRVALMLLSALLGKQKVAVDNARKLCGDADVLKVDFGGAGAGTKGCINRIHVTSDADSVWVSVDDLIESLKP
jgi:hypothetical protein